MVLISTSRPVRPPVRAGGKLGGGDAAGLGGAAAWSREFERAMSFKCSSLNIWRSSIFLLSLATNSFTFSVLFSVSHGTAFRRSMETAPNEQILHSYPSFSLDWGVIQWSACGALEPYFELLITQNLKNNEKHKYTFWLFLHEQDFNF